MKQVNECRICKTPLRKYLDLGNVPLCNNLITQYSPVTEKFPIRVLFCDECYLSQLSVVIDPEKLYSHYVYHSSVSQTFKQHCFDLAVKLKAEFPFDLPLVVDIASNDGCLLRQFKKAGYQRLLGIDPAQNLMNKYENEEDFKDAIPTLNSFWSKEVAREYIAKANCADIITATNVFAHVDDLNEFLDGINIALKDKGIFVVEVPYFVDLFRKNEFDTIYHEHLSYFLLAPLIRLFNGHALPIFKVEHLAIHGGSIRIYASKNAYPEDRSVEDMLEFEQMNGFYDYSNYISFATKVDGVRNKLGQILLDLYNCEKKVMGYGASAKGISLLNYCGVQTPYIHSIVDETPDKQGKMTPGSHIDIVPFEMFEKERPDYILLLAWNFAPELIEKTKHLGAKYIVPIPDVRII